ncbi:MAG TPA: inositol monophosphatase [Candidatus Hydrogenedentes bacterium]|nr:inositol monophosphatase [Candidatus Hydrogenedentota bacterium]HNT86427.1 inositol monophosphatase [Candidatus Hydrogenedentota bacterium]
MKNVETKLIEEFLVETGDYVRERYAARERVAVVAKAHASDLLTEVDLTVQKRAVEAVARAFPRDAFIGEEEGLARFPANPDGRCWVMDPIDGTYNFVRGLLPMFGVSLAFVEHGVPQAGGVLFPVTGDLLIAERGGGAYRNGQRIRVSTVRTLEECSLGVDFGDGGDRISLFERGAGLLRAVGQLRCLGCAVLSLCQIATGDADAYVHLTLTPWDYAASQIIVEEAGGRASRLDGGPLRLFDGKRGVLFSNSALHDAIVELFD